MTITPGVPASEFQHIKSAIHTWAELLSIDEMRFGSAAFSLDYKVTVKYGMPPRLALDVMCTIAPALVDRFNTTDLDKLLLVPFSEVEKALPAHHPVLQAAFHDHVAYRSLYDIGQKFDEQAVLRPLPDRRDVVTLTIRVPDPLPYPLQPSQVVRVVP